MDKRSPIIEQLNHLFNPRSVAVIGASETLGTWGFGIMSRLFTSPGRKVYPVTKKSSQILGLKAYESITEIPDPVDFAVIAIPAAQTPGVMRECVDKGVKVALIVSGGLAESGEGGEEIEKEVVRIAKQGGIRFIGPNSMGHVDTASGFSTLAWIEEVTKGPIAFISQSGTYGERFLYSGMRAGVGFSKFISSGNEADLHLEDYLEYLAQDEDTKIIAAYVEGLREGKRFFKLAKEITKKKPVIIMKSGRTRSSARAAKSHTAALSGADAVYDSMFKQARVIRVEDDDELFDVAMALLSLPLPKGKRIGVLTEGGGIGVVAAQACERIGLEIPSFSQATMEKLNSILPARWSHGNPVDMTDMITAGKLVTFPCLWAVMGDENVDAAMLIGGIGATTYFPQSFLRSDNVPASTREAFSRMIKSVGEEEQKNLDIIMERVNEYQKPLVVVKIMPEVTEEPESFNLLRKKGMPVYPNPHRAAKVLHHLAWYRERFDT